MSYVPGTAGAVILAGRLAFWLYRWRLRGARKRRDESEGRGADGEQQQRLPARPTVAQEHLDAELGA